MTSFGEWAKRHDEELGDDTDTKGQHSTEKTNEPTESDERRERMTSEDTDPSERM